MFVVFTSLSIIFTFDYENTNIEKPKNNKEVWTKTE